jgi:hypothetical protein
MLYGPTYEKRKRPFDKAGLYASVTPAAIGSPTALPCSPKEIPLRKLEYEKLINSEVY